MDLGNSDMNLLPGERLFDLEYVDDIALLCDDTQAMHSALNHLAISVCRHGMCIAPLKCKILLQGWQDRDSALTLGSEQIRVVEKFVYLSSHITASDIYIYIYMVPRHTNVYIFK